MLEALQIAATGLHAQQANVDAIAHNLANVNTPGYKKSRVAFFDLVGDASRPATGGADASSVNPGARLGAGVQVASIVRLFDAGDLRKTEQPLDLAIAGDGFLEVQTTDGARAYTRGGTLKIGTDGTLSTASGQPLKPGLVVPADLTTLTITADGRVLASGPSRATALEIGTLQMVRFPSPGTLQPAGEGLWRATEASGEPIAGRPGEDAMGTLRQGHLEGSNVKLVEEMVGLMVAQRAYEASVKVVQASDEMLGLVNTLRK